MKEYLYFFGYETPSQSKNNEKHGWDDEEHQAVYILADNEQHALEWGHNIAESFFKALYDEPEASWSRCQYAAWIEEGEGFSQEELRKLPRVRYGEYPDIRRMVEECA